MTRAFKGPSLARGGRLGVGWGSVLVAGLLYAGWPGAVMAASVDAALVSSDLAVDSTPAAFESHPGQAVPVGGYSHAIVQAFSDIRTSVFTRAMDYVPAESGSDTLEFSVPVPAAVWLFVSGVGALTYVARRRSRPPRPEAEEQPGLGATRRKAIGKGSGAGRGREGARLAAGSVVLQRFEELSEALTEHPDVIVGRRFGRPCVKFGKKPFLVCDDNALVFCVGAEAAPRLLQSLPKARPWNPKQGRQPKRSWLMHGLDDGEALVVLTAAAFERVLSGQGALDEDREEAAVAVAGLGRAPHATPADSVVRLG